MRMDLEFLGQVPKKLLIVDDERSVRELLADGLGEMGYETRTAGGAAEALQLLDRGPVHLVLTDIEMPGGDGLQLLDSIKERDPELDVVMVTGVVDASTAIRAIRRGASDYVTKPFNLDEVQIVVDRTLEKRRLVLENRAYQKHLRLGVRRIPGSHHRVRVFTNSGQDSGHFLGQVFNGHVPSPNLYSRDA